MDRALHCGQLPLGCPAGRAVFASTFYAGVLREQLHPTQAQPFLALCTAHFRFSCWLKDTVPARIVHHTWVETALAARPSFLHRLKSEASWMVMPLLGCSILLPLDLIPWTLAAQILVPGPARLQAEVSTISSRGHHVRSGITFQRLKGGNFHWERGGSAGIKILRNSDLWWMYESSSGGCHFLLSMMGRLGLWAPVGPAWVPSRKACISMGSDFSCIASVFVCWCVCVTCEGCKLVCYVCIEAVGGIYGVGYSCVHECVYYCELCVYVWCLCDMHVYSWVSVVCSCVWCFMFTDVLCIYSSVPIFSRHLLALIAVLMGSHEMGFKSGSTNWVDMTLSFASFTVIYRGECVIGVYLIES